MRSISCPTGLNRHKKKNLEPFGRTDLDAFAPLKLAQIVFKLVSMFEDATVAAARAPQTGQIERNINRYQRQEKIMYILRIRWF